MKIKRMAEEQPEHYMNYNDVRVFSVLAKCNPVSRPTLAQTAQVGVRS